MWVLTRELLTNFCKSAYIREFIVLAKFRRNEQNNLFLLKPKCQTSTENFINFLRRICIVVFIRGTTASKSQDRLKRLLPDCSNRGLCGQQSAYPLTLISVFITGFRYFSYQVATQLSSRGWVDPVPDPIRPETFLGYSRESNPGPLGWQSDVLTTIPNRRSCIVVPNLKYYDDDFDCYTIMIKSVVLMQMVLQFSLKTDFNSSKLQYYLHNDY